MNATGFGTDSEITVFVRLATTEVDVGFIIVVATVETGLDHSVALKILIASQ